MNAVKLAMIVIKFFVKIVKVIVSIVMNLYVNVKIKNAKFVLNKYALANVIIIFI